SGRPARLRSPPDRWCSGPAPGQDKSVPLPALTDWNAQAAANESWCPAVTPLRRESGRRYRPFQDRPGRGEGWAPHPMQRVTCDDARQARSWQEAFGPGRPGGSARLISHNDRGRGRTGQTTCGGLARALQIELAPPPSSVARSLRLGAGELVATVTVSFEDPVTRRPVA